MGTCLIIGPGGHLGEAIARRFGNGGMDLALVGRNPARLAQQAASLAQSQIRARTYQCELTDTDSLVRGLGAAEREGGTPECLVYNAALVRPGSALETSWAELATSMAVDALGAHAAACRFGPAMKARRHGSLLFTGGGLALHPESAYSQLSAGKAALRALALCLEQELAPDVNVAIFEICGAIRTHSSLDPALIADQYWDVHSGRSPAGEVVLD